MGGKNGGQSQFALRQAEAQNQCRFAWNPSTGVAEPSWTFFLLRAMTKSNKRLSIEFFRILFREV